MSLNKVYWPSLSWGCRLYVMSFLNLEEVWMLGCTSKAAYLTFLREIDARVGKPLNSHRFLPLGYFTSSSKHKTCLVSYPRSGNSFVRRRLEQMTGIITGSDSRPNRTLSKALLRCGFIGEGICDDSVFIVKSHFPERLGYRIFNSHRILLLVRNPFAAIESYFHMGLTNTHNKSLSDQVRHSSKISELFHEFLINEVKVWKMFYEYWLEESRKQGVPLMMIRFEDLLIQSQSGGMDMSTAGVVRGIVDFIRSDEKCALNHLLTKICSDGGDIISTAEAGGPGYTPRKIGDIMDTCFLPYTYQQIELICAELSELLCIFGYNVNRNENDTCRDSCKFTLSLSRLEQQQQQQQHSSPQPTAPATKINKNFCIREADDKFGRCFTDLRKSFTKGDTVPFECTQ